MSSAKIKPDFYRVELNKTIWEVPQRYQNLIPVGAGAYGQVWWVEFKLSQTINVWSRWLFWVSCFRLKPLKLIFELAFALTHQSPIGSLKARSCYVAVAWVVFCCHRQELIEEFQIFLEYILSPYCFVFVLYLDTVLWLFLSNPISHWGILTKSIWQRFTFQLMKSLGSTQTHKTIFLSWSAVKIKTR